MEARPQQHESLVVLVVQIRDGGNIEGLPSETPYIVRYLVIHLREMGHLILREEKMEKWANVEGQDGG